MDERKILLLGPLPPSIGGDSVSTLNLAGSRYWKENGYSIDAVSTASRRGLRMEGDPYGPGDVLRFSRIAFACIRKLPGTSAVLLWANAGFLCSAGPSLAGIFRIYRREYVIKLFGTSLPRRIRGLAPARRRSVLRMLEGAAFILPQTEGLAEELSKETSIPLENLICFPNFVPDESFAAPLARAEFEGKLVFVGQIKREKGIFTIMEAIRGRPDLSCDFYGPVMARDRSMFMGEVADRENLRYMGILPPERVVGAMREYDALLLPSFHEGEGYPGAILQAFAAGLPVIASDFKYIPEIVEDRVRGLLVRPESPAALAGAIDLMRSDAPLRARMTANALEFAGQFSEKRIVDGILIRQVLGGLFLR